jgi:hypothetical protein
MAAANPQRTSWVSEEVSGNLRVEWYRPIEAYIPQNSQIIASGGLLFISTARGLYALDAADGHEVWRFDTELPLGNSPTVSDGVVYVAGYDRKLHALSAVSGLPLWSFDGAKAGYDTNPLVVNGIVFLGNRDGHMYAVGAHGTSRQGQLLWSYKTGGPIHLSAAYKDGIIFFAANDNFAYALNAASGNLIWKSEKLPGDGFHSYWPVIYEDKVIFSGASSYRHNLNPGTDTIKDIDGNGYQRIFDMEKDEFFLGLPEGSLIGEERPGDEGTNGYPVINISKVTDYLEKKPWRRTVIALNISNGREYTFDSDRDGIVEYLPFAFYGTESGNRYPPVIGQDNVLYQSNIYQSFYIPQGRIMGWRESNQNLIVLPIQGAVDEPQAISMGGGIIYRSICCDRVGDYVNYLSRGRSQSAWNYSFPLENLGPGYDEMWTVLPGHPRMSGWYKGNTQSINGIYHNHGDQNPIVPYNDRLYIHRSNAIFAFGSGEAKGKLAIIPIQNKHEDRQSLSRDDLRARLELEITKIIDAGHLRPGYYNNGQFPTSELTDYFDNPGDTLYTLSIAYPHISAHLQGQLRNYLSREFQDYFDPMMYSSIGWSEGSAREAMPIPTDLLESISNLNKSTYTGPRWSWSYPPHNFYAMWKYTQVLPGEASKAYLLAKGKIEVPVPAVATTDYFQQKPYELNAYIAGYTGFLELQSLAGKEVEDRLLRERVTSELARLIDLRVEIFSKDTYWVEERYHRRSLNIARNFMMLVPELGDILNERIFAKVNEAVDEYNYIAPYWFVSRYEAMMNEGVMSPLYNYPAMFQAKAYILKQNRNELSKYLDVPGFERGDLFYIQNLISILESQE